MSEHDELDLDAIEVQLDTIAQALDIHERWGADPTSEHTEPLDLDAIERRWRRSVIGYLIPDHLVADVAALVAEVKRLRAAAPIDEAYLGHLDTALVRLESAVERLLRRSAARAAERREGTS